MKGNPHYRTLGEERLVPEAGLVHATLALAFEQRTANLLALHAALRERSDNGQALDTLTEIKERLGLTDGDG